MGLVVLKIKGVGSAQAERFAVVRRAGSKIPNGLDEAALVFHAEKIAVVDQSVGVAADLHHLVGVLELAVIDAEVLAVADDRQHAVPHSGIGIARAVEGDARDAEWSSFHADQPEGHLSGILRGTIVANDRLVNSGPLDGDGLHLGPMAGVPSLRPHGRPGGKLDDVAILGCIDRLPDGFRRQGGSRAGFGVKKCGRNARGSPKQATHQPQTEFTFSSCHRLISLEASQPNTARG